MIQDNSSATLLRYIKHLKIPVTANSVALELEKHPDHSSLFAISEVLNNWNVPNGAFKVQIEDLNELPLPLIVRLSSNKGEFALLEAISNEGYTISNERLKEKLLSKEQFEKAFAGTVLIAQAHPEAGEADYSRKKRKEQLDFIRTPFIITGCLFVLLVLISQMILSTGFVWQTAVLSLLKVAGLTATVLLLIQSIDSNNPMIERLCSGGNNRDCNAILASNAAKVTEGLSWSEVGFFYFAGSLPALLYSADSIFLMQVLAFINVLCLPYTFYSVHYQYRAGQWCAFCCTVQALLWLEFFAFWHYVFSPLQAASMQGLLIILICFAVPVMLWAFIKPFLLKASQVEPLRKQVQRYKYNTKLFRKVLEEQMKHELPDETDTIILGNPEAENLITIVSNPYCQPCAKAHKILDEWITGLENIKVQVIFSTPDNEQDKKVIIARHLISLKASSGTELQQKAMHDWYEQKQKDYEKWAEIYPAQNPAMHAAPLARQREWCAANKIKSTPTIFINGHKLPGPWQLEDIKYFLN